MSKRPTINDETVIYQAAKILAVKVAEWLDDGETAPTDSELIENIKDAIRHNDDGFDIAVEMQDIGYDPDAELVDILDKAFIIKKALVEEACEDWVIVNKINGPDIKTKVLVNGNTGIVIKNHKDGRSTVSIPALGHVLEGAGTHGKVINWEDLVIANELEPVV
jgi:hypothetical protein